jgi:Acetyltransferase (GNAT) domain
MGEIFHGFDEAEPLGRSELDREGLTSLFDRYEWFKRTHAECPVSGVPLIARASANGINSWLFLSKENAGKAKGLASWYTLAFRPVFGGNDDAIIRMELLQNIARKLRNQVSHIELSPMHEAECKMTAMAFRQAGWIAIEQVTGCNWTIDVADKSFAEYWATRPSQLRKTVKSKRGKANMDIQIYSDFDEQAWRDYESVYADSWKPEEGSAQFLYEMAISEGQSGTLRLGIGSVDGTAVAAQLWTCEHARAIAHKVAHRPCASAYSAGTLLSAAMFEHVIDRDNVEQIDFGTGDSSYKSSWMDHRAPLYTLSLYNKHRVAGLMGAAKLRIGKKLRGN